MLSNEGQIKRIENWWNNGEQDRPLILCSCGDPVAEPLPPVKDLDAYWNNPEAMTDRVIKSQDRTIWFGEAIPYHYPEFGAAALAIVLGAGKEYIKTESIWAAPCFEEIKDLAEINPHANQDFYDLIWNTIKKSVELSKDHHMVGIYCLGSPVDTLAGLMGTENALFSLAEDPLASKQVLDKIFECQLAEFEKYIQLLRSSGFDYSTNWHGIRCGGRGAAIQEDCSCMLSEDMFTDFCLPYVRDTVQSMDHSFYHMDGPGALRHLDAVRKIPNLKVIQWQPGIGQEQLKNWLDVIHTILSSGKSCHLYAKAAEIPMLIRECGNRGLCITVTDSSYENCCRLAEEYKLESYQYRS